jgi:hypothetical protein
MIIVYVEDRAIKDFIVQVKSSHGFLCRPRIPAGGGFSAVLKTVHELSNTDLRVIGIIEGDAKKHAEQWGAWTEVEDKIFVTKKGEIEEYIYAKRDSLLDRKVNVSEMQYSEFKTFFNKDENKALSFRALKKLSKQECSEIANLVEFIRGH